MQEALEARVIRLEQAVEQQVTVHDLELVETRIRVQILRLGEEVRAGFSATHERFEALEGKLGGVEGKFDGLAGKVDGLAGKVDGLAGQVYGLEGRFDGLEGKFDGLEGKFDGLEGALETRTAELLAVIDTESRKTRAEMRVLHEDLVARLKTLSER